MQGGERVGTWCQVSQWRGGEGEEPSEKSLKRLSGGDAKLLQGRGLYSGMCGSEA